MKRFYDHAGIGAQQDGYSVMLDGKALRTPARKPLLLPNAAMARAVADEWAAQGDKIAPASMPLTRLVNHVIDRADGNRDAILSQICAYMATDLLRYRASSPDSLVQRQAAAWDPLVAWAEQHLGVDLPVTAEVMPLAADGAADMACRAAIKNMNMFQITALGEVVTAAGSLIIGLALLAGRIDAAGAWAAASVDDDYQAERWGADQEAAKMLAVRRAGLDAGARLLALAGPLPSPAADDMSRS